MNLKYTVKQLRNYIVKKNALLSSQRLCQIDLSFEYHSVMQITTKRVCTKRQRNSWRAILRMISSTNMHLLAEETEEDSDWSETTINVNAPRCTDSILPYIVTEVSNR